MNSRLLNVMSKLTLAGATAVLVACNSSGGDSGSATTNVSGTIVAAPVSGADVIATDGTNTVAGPVKTSATGEYTLSIPNASLGQDLYIQATGGTFTDEATGNAATGGEMLAFMAANSLSNGDEVSVTPGSTIIAHLVRNHNRTMTQAQNAFANAFGYTPDLSVTPADATTAPAADEDAASTLAGFRAGSFSQLAMELGLSQDNQFELFKALAQDLSDDALDGEDASGAVAIGTTGQQLAANIQNRFARALMNFKDNANNQTGLDNAKIGNLPFAKVALTNSYKFEYMAMGMMEPMNGKSTFKLRITDRVTGNGVAGAMPMMMVMMHMATHEHSTPQTGCVSDATAGDYICTVYYVMPSQMMDGTSMGYWDIKLTVNNEEAHFYPAVMMAMANMDTIQARVFGVNDKVMDMNTGLMTGRTYFIFKEALAAVSGVMGKYDFSVFVAARDTMMSFPAIYNGGTLNSNTVSANVEISVDDGVSWVPATDNGNGIWSVTDLSLTNGVQNQIRVRLTVNGEVKTMDAATQDPGVNDYQTFTVTPGMSM